MNVLKQFLFMTIVLLGISFKMQGQVFFMANQKLPTVKKGNVYGVINSRGIKIIDYKYENIRYTQHHFLVSAEKNGPCNVVDTVGKTLFSTISNVYYIENERFVWIKKLNNLKTGKWYLYNKDGTIISKSAYDNIFFTNYTDHTLVLMDSTYSFVDTTGKVVFSNYNYLAIKGMIANFYAGKNAKPVDLQKTTVNHPVVVIYKDKASKRFGAKCNGKSIVAPVFAEIKKTDFNVLIVRKSNKYGLIDFNGKIVMGFEFDKLSEVGETTIIVANDGKFGLIDRISKKILIPLEYKGLYTIK